MAAESAIESAARPRHSRWRRVRLWLVRLILIAGGSGVAVLGVLIAVIVHYGTLDHARPADAIIVLGGGIDGTTRRTEHAAALYAQGYAPVLVCSGGTERRQEFPEAERCRRVAVAHGVPSSAIVVETGSYSTEENAIEVAALARARGWQAVLVVSDDYHLWRAHLLFERQGLRAWTSPAQITTGALARSEELHSVVREAAATCWYVGKSLLGLPYTNFKAF